MTLGSQEMLELVTAIRWRRRERVKWSFPVKWSTMLTNRKMVNKIIFLKAF